MAPYMSELVDFYGKYQRLLLATLSIINILNLPVYIFKILNTQGAVINGF